MGPDDVEAYPLQWPPGWARTPVERREHARFKCEPGKARDGLLRELDRLGAISPKLSSNIPTRNDGLPYARHAQPSDSGVAVYFILKGKQMSFACDKWRTVADNMHAIELTISALRGIERWGSSSILERAFAGFAALPAPPSARPFTEVLGIPAGANLAVAKVARNSLLRKYHPDFGSEPNVDKMAEVNLAYGEAEKVLK